jgi:hypothetical protein
MSSLAVAAARLKVTPSSTPRRASRSSAWAAARAAGQGAALTGRQGHSGAGFAGQGIARGAAGKAGEAQGVGALQAAQHPHQQLDGVAPFFVDVHPRVPAAQAGEGQRPGLPARQGSVAGVPGRLTFTSTPPAQPR